jgi:site-specific DNA-methyltransferase (adenine-specific)
MDWETPQDFFDELNKEFNFGWDLAASEENAKCDHFFTEVDDATCQTWPDHCVCWCNPPYGNKICAFVRQAYEQSKPTSITSGVTTVMLIPARTDTRWFHDYIYGKHEVRFIKGRLRFVGAPHPAPFPSMLVIFRPRRVYED